MKDLEDIAAEQQTQLIERTKMIRERIEDACEKAGRSSDEITVVAATRTLMAGTVTEAGLLGIHDFGEEFIPEGVTKMPVVNQRITQASWHFLGTIQPKKLNVILENFDWIHTFSRSTLLRALREVKIQPIFPKPKVLVEVNPFGDKKRRGAGPEEVLELVQRLSDIEFISLEGLSFFEERSLKSDDVRNGYQAVGRLYDELKAAGSLPEHAKTLAFGDSKHLEAAISAGSTMVRLGTAIFGARPGGTAEDDPFASLVSEENKN